MTAARSAEGPGASTGGATGRTNALTIVCPLRGSPLRLRMMLAWVDAKSRTKLRTADELRFISAIRWTVLPPFEPPARRRLRRSFDALFPRQRREQRHHLLFESNFDGDWDEYLDAFGTVLGGDLHNLVRWCAGYPGMDDLALFKAWARSVDVLPEHYASRYPSLTSSDIRQELNARYGSAEITRQMAEREWGKVEPLWTTLVLPIRPGHTASAATAGRALARGSGQGATSALIRGLGEIHFARVVVLEQPTRDWLLITFVHDREIEPALQALLEADRDDPDRPIHALLRTLDGIPVDDPTWTEEDTRAALLAHRPPTTIQRRRPLFWRSLAGTTRRHLQYGGYPGYTAAEIALLEADARRSTTWPDDEVVQ